MTDSRRNEGMETAVQEATMIIIPDLELDDSDDERNIVVIRNDDINDWLGWDI
jgi:hypothetical protein